MKYFHQLHFLRELNLDVADNEERGGQVDVDAAVVPPDLVHLGHEGPHGGLPDLELKTNLQ